MNDVTQISLHKLTIEQLEKAHGLEVAEYVDDLRAALYMMRSMLENLGASGFERSCQKAGIQE